MIYDVIVLIIFIGLIILNIHRGAARAFAGILVAVIAYTGATTLGTYLSGIAYDAIFKPAIDNAVTQALSNLGTQTVDQVAELMPSWITGTLNLAGVDLSQLVTDHLSSTADIASQAVNTAIRPVAVNILSFFITIILFLLLWLLLSKLVIKPLLKLFDLPVIRTVNKALGGVIGFLDAFLLVSMLAYLLKLLLPGIQSQSGIFNESTIYNSFIFYHFYSGNIFSSISSWIGL